MLRNMSQTVCAHVLVCMHLQFNILAAFDMAVSIHVLKSVP